MNGCLRMRSAASAGRGRVRLRDGPLPSVISLAGNLDSTIPHDACHHPDRMKAIRFDSTSTRTSSGSCDARAPDRPDASGSRPQGGTVSTETTSPLMVEDELG